MAMMVETTTVGKLEERKARLAPIIKKALKNGRMISTVGMPTEDWLVARAMLGIGASDVSTALGINDYKSPYELWKEKLAEEVEAKDNDIMMFGRVIEEPIAQIYMKMTGREVIEDMNIRIHPEHDCLFANLDRIIIDNGDGKGAGVLECKSTISSVYKSWLDEFTGTQSIPINYYCQVQAELSVTGFKWAVLAVLITDRRQVKIIPIERDEEYIQRQNQVLVAWYNGYVKEVVPPERKAADYSFVDPIAGTTKEADEEILAVIDELKEKQGTEKTLKEEIDLLKDKVKEFAGDDEAITKNGEILATYKTISKKEYVVKAKTYRELRFKTKKGEL